MNATIKSIEIQPEYPEDGPVKLEFWRDANGREFIEASTGEGPEYREINFSLNEVRRVISALQTLLEHNA